mmetsp:Transcript_27683/g.110880  ORF Transcript_27683/g.110880 Transcript_27683/m.110880 type:complete len:115 (-) Transcript_27683:174-518(-)
MHGEDHSNTLVLFIARAGVRELQYAYRQLGITAQHPLHGAQTQPRGLIVRRTTRKSRAHGRRRVYGTISKDMALTAPFVHVPPMFVHGTARTSQLPSAMQPLAHAPQKLQPKLP